MKSTFAREGSLLKKKRFWLLLLPVVTLILEILPFGAVCNFANPNGAPYRYTYSYFSLTPFGYANSAPFLTALLTCVMLLLLLGYAAFDRGGMRQGAKIVSVVATVLSLCPLLLGAVYYSLLGAAITLCLLVQTVFLWLKTNWNEEEHGFMHPLEIVFFFCSKRLI